MQQIIADQIGYRINDRKIAILREKSSAKFVIKDANSKKEVFKGKLQGPCQNKQAGETNYIADFSEFTIPGKYVVGADGIKDSYPFVIGDDIYENVISSMLRFFYLQRCGIKLPEKYAGQFKHECCHDSPAYLYGTNDTIDVRGGWHDAGDYGRYIVAAAVTVADLLIAYENNPLEFGKNLNISGSSSIVPDLLNEVRYELEWMLKMQNPNTGVVYHKVTCENFPDLPILPEEEKEKLVVCAPSITATADFAAVMAMATGFYMDYDELFAKRCVRASIKAYDAMKGMFMPGGFKNPKGIVTGEYSDTQDADERFWAAAELYKLTGEKCYHDDIQRLLKKGIMHGYGWEDVGSFGNRAYLTTTKYHVDEELLSTIKDGIVSYGKMLMEIAQNDCYAFSLLEYEWGSNMYVANNAYHMFDAYQLTGEVEFLDYAKEQIHYLLGKNANAVCFVTGFGSLSPKYPHHRPSIAIHTAMPGMLVGGPDEGYHDPCVEEQAKDNPPAKVYVDHMDSYSTNEVTIYWNSAILLAMSII
jgi:endoglucanase